MKQRPMTEQNAALPTPDSGKRLDVSELEERKIGRHTHWFRKEGGMQVCGAGLRKRPDNFRCGQSVGLHELRGRCRLHGGSKSVVGRPVTTGTGIRFLRGRLGDIEEQAKNDLAVSDMQGPVAALVAVAARVGELVDEKDSPHFRGEAIEKFGAVQDAVASGRASAMVNALDELGRHLEKGADEADSLDQFADVSLKLHTAIASTWRIDLAKGNAFNKRHMEAMFAEFGRIVICEVEDPAKSRAILDKIEAMLVRADRNIRSD